MYTRWERKTILLIYVSCWSSCTYQSCKSPGLLLSHDHTKPESRFVRLKTKSCPSVWERVQTFNKIWNPSSLNWTRNRMTALDKMFQHWRQRNSLKNTSTYDEVQAAVTDPRWTPKGGGVHFRGATANLHGNLSYPSLRGSTRRRVTRLVEMVQV